MDFVDINTTAVFEFLGNNVLDADQLGTDLAVLSQDASGNRYITIIDLSNNTIVNSNSYTNPTSSVFHGTNIRYLDSAHLLVHGAATGALPVIVRTADFLENYFSGTAHIINQVRLQQLTTEPSGTWAAYVSSVVTSGTNRTYGVLEIIAGTGAGASEYALPTANNINCVITKPTNGLSATFSFLLGTNEGTVVEVDKLGNVLNTITLPTVPGRAVSNPSPVANMSWDSFTNSLFITGTDGTLYKYFFSGPSYGVGAVAPTYVGQWIVAVPINFTVDAVMLSNCYNGHFFTCPAYTTANSPSPLIYWSNDVEPLMMIGKVGTPGIQVFGLNSTNNIGWYVAALSGKNVLYTFPLYNVQYTTVETRAQYPAVGTDVAARIIRLNYFGPSYARVDLDTSIAAGPASLAAKQGQNYYEIALIGTPFSSEKFDARTFEA